MDKQKPKIFLSYAREDMGIAKQLYNDLKRYGLDVWLAPSSPGIQNRYYLGIDDSVEKVHL